VAIEGMGSLKVSAHFVFV